MRPFAILVLILGLVPHARGEAPAETEATAFRRDIVHLMEITGTARMGQRIAGAIASQMYATLQHRRPGLPEQAAEIMHEVALALFASEEASLIERVVPIYERHFTHGEVTELIRFYESPTGRKTIHVMPDLLSEAFRASQEWSRGVHPRLEPLMLERLKQEGLIPQDVEKLFGAV